MSRGNTGSYGHRIREVSYNEEKLTGFRYRLTWKYDLHHKGSRLRYPRVRERLTDEKGALRFAKKWKIEFKLPKVP